MKNKLYRNLFAFVLTLLVALLFAACTPEVHIHTDGNSSEANASSESELIASTEETTDTSVAESEPTTSVASSVPSKVESTPSKNSTSSKDSTSKSTSSKAPSNDTISTSKAKSIALADAGLKASQIYDYEIELDRDNGVLHYDVSFEYNGSDYDYEINASTGKIISVEKPNATSNEATISKSKAKSLALKDAGFNESEISNYRIELEKDDGVWKYEISFNKGYLEYEYTLNASNGKIIDKEIDD